MYIDLLKIANSIINKNILIEIELEKNKDTKRKCVDCYNKLNKNFNLSRKEMQNKGLKTKTYCPGCGRNKPMYKGWYILINKKITDN